MTNEPSGHAQIENLIVGHFDGTLNEDQEQELATELGTSAESKQFFLSYMRMEGRLHSLGRDGFLREPSAEPAFKPELSAAKSADVETLVHSSRQRLRLFAASSLAVCASVMLMLLSGVLWPSTVNANSVLKRAQAAASELIDRTYRVTLSREGERSSMRELRVDARGGGRFVLRPLDEAYVVGSDGTDYWLTRQDEPVWVTRKRGALVPKLRRTMINSWLFGIASSPNEPLLLDMAGVLSQIERKHDIELMDSTRSAEHHVRATLRRGRHNPPSNTPETIDFWADAESGVGLRAEMRWADGRQMQFELLGSVPLSDRWYHYSEHASDDGVRRLPAYNRP